MNRIPVLAGLVLVGVVCATVNGYVHAQPLPDHPRYAVEHFGERFGLGAATVLSLAQDERGFLWIGTETGLFRYDGAGVKRFGRDQGLPGELVQLIVPASDGSVWVRTRKGISHFSKEQFTNVSLPTEAGGLRDVFQSFSVEKDGTLFIATDKGLLRLTPDGRSTLYSGAAGLPGQIDAIVRAADGTVWFAGGGQLLKIAPFLVKAEFVSTLNVGGEHVIALLPTNRNRLWIRTEHHIGTLDTQSPNTRPVWLPADSSAANAMGGPSLDRNSNLMLPTSKGLYRYLGNGRQLIDHRNGLTSSAIFSALEDREGGIWLGTAGAGLDHWPGSQQWSGWTDSEGLPDALVLGVARDSHSRLWVATNTALALWDPARRGWSSWTQDGLAGAGVRQLLTAKDGSVWALFPGKGLFRFGASSARPRPERVPDKPGVWQPARISAAPDGSIWAAGNGSVRIIRYYHGRFDIEELRILENQNDIRNVSVSPGGVVWTTGSQGLSRLANGSWQHFHKEDGLLASQVTDVRAITDDEAWIGYPDEGAVTRVRLSDGRLLTSNFPRGMCALGSDVNRNVWVEMDEGLGVVSPGGTLRRFTERDGLIWDDINCDAFWNEADGTILIGTSKGLARYDPRQEAPKSPEPVAVMTSALFGKSERLEEKNPELAYSENTFVARFAAPVFHDPDRVSCRYRLGGLEAEFTETGFREVRYPSLPAGHYNFEVSCGSAELGWSPPATYAFSIQAPWWRSWWAQFCEGALLVLLVWSFVLYRTRRHRLEKERLEIRVAERNAELARANRELQEASLKDPLTGVWNRRFFHSTISADASQATRAYRSIPEDYSRDHRDLIFYLVDIDSFKEVNDKFGHDAGDRLLVEIARRLESVVRESDFLIRWGGEEFLIVCRSTDRDHAGRMAERILSSIGATPFHLGSGRLLFRTCSVGWAPFPWCSEANADLSVEQVLRLADHGLLLAKRRGKDQAIGILPSEKLALDSQKYSRLEELLERSLLIEICTARTTRV